MWILPTSSQIHLMITRLGLSGYWSGVVFPHYYEACINYELRSHRAVNETPLTLFNSMRQSRSRHLMKLRSSTRWLWLQLYHSIYSMHQWRSHHLMSLCPSMRHLCLYLLSQFSEIWLAKFKLNMTNVITKCLGFVLLKELQHLFIQILVIAFSMCKEMNRFFFKEELKQEAKLVCNSILMPFKK